VFIHTHTSVRTKLTRLASLLPMMLLSLTIVGGQTPVAFAHSVSAHSTGWNLVWSDDFKSSTLDTTKWTALNGGGFYTPATSEYYAPDDTYTQNGLVLKSERRAYNKYNYTSGGVSSRDKFSLLYGKIEWQARLAKGRGLWPAIWLMPQDGSGRFEIDALEMLGDNPHSLYMTNHWVDQGGNDQQDMTTFSGPDFGAAFHVFDVQWLPGEIDWLIDGVVQKKVTANISNIPMYMYINTAVGANGTWPGAPDGSTIFPQYTTINYVHVYQLVPPVPGNVTGHFSTAPHPTNLTKKGTTDWVNWGLSAATSVDRKATVPQVISPYSALGTGAYTRTTGGGTTLSWTDGTPDATATNAGGGTMVCGANNGFQFTVPADTTTKTLYVYLAVQQAQGKFSASLSDGSGSYTKTSLNNLKGSTAGGYKLTYNASTGGQKLTVQWSVQSASGCVVLQAAALG